MATPIEQVIGDNIKKRRSDLGLSQTELGREIGMYFGTAWPAQTVSAAEKGRRQFIAAEVMVLARILHCRVQDLFTPETPVAVKLTDNFSTAPDYSAPLDGPGITDELLRKRFSETRAMLQGAKGMAERIEEEAQKLNSQINTVDQWMSSLNELAEDPEGAREAMEEAIRQAGGEVNRGANDA